MEDTESIALWIKLLGAALPVILFFGGLKVRRKFQVFLRIVSALICAIESAARYSKHVKPIVTKHMAQAGDDANLIVDTILAEKGWLNKTALWLEEHGGKSE